MKFSILDKIIRKEISFKTPIAFTLQERNPEYILLGIFHEEGQSIRHIKFLVNKRQQNIALEDDVLFKKRSSKLQFNDTIKIPNDVTIQIRYTPKYRL